MDDEETLFGGTCNWSHIKAGQPYLAVWYKIYWMAYDHALAAGGTISTLEEVRYPLRPADGNNIDAESALIQGWTSEDLVK